MKAKDLGLALSDALYKREISASKPELDHFRDFLSELVPDLPDEFHKWFNFKSPSMVDDKKGWTRAQQELSAKGKIDVDFSRLMTYTKDQERKAVENNDLLFFMKIEDLLLSLCSEKEKKLWKK
jgi:hypothetical protein